MKVYRSHVNDYPFVDFHHWEFRPLEIIQLFTDNGGSDQELIEAVCKLDHVYVRFRELDALENRIGSTLERFQIRNRNNDVADNLPEGFQNVFDALRTVIEAKKGIVQDTKKEELTSGRESLLRIVSYLEAKGIIEFIA